MKLSRMEIVGLADLRVDNVRIERRDLKKAKREFKIHEARVLLAREEVRKANEKLTLALDIKYSAESAIMDITPDPWKGSK